MSTIINRKRLALLAAAILAAAGSSYAALHLHKPAEPAGVATVNGAAIAAATVADLESSGISRADALDRAITARVAADAAAARYPEESSKALRQAHDAVLSQLYIQRRMAELSQGVTDAETKQLYDEQITDAVFRAYRMRFVMLGDLPTAQDLLAKLRAGDKDARAKLVPLSKDDAFVPARELPYNLGVLAAKAAAGDVLEPVMIRNGVLILAVDAIKALDKPSLESVKVQLRNAVASQKFADELKALRAKAEVTLHG